MSRGGVKDGDSHESGPFDDKNVFLFLLYGVGFLWDGAVETLSHCDCHHSKETIIQLQVQLEINASSRSPPP